MPHGITQCYLPPGRGDIPALTPAEAGTRLSDPGGTQGWVDLVGLLHTEMVYPPEVVTHPGTNRARRALTPFMRRTPLTTTPRRQPPPKKTEPTNRIKYCRQIITLSIHLCLRHYGRDTARPAGAFVTAGSCMSIPRVAYVWLQHKNLEPGCKNTT